MKLPNLHKDWTKEQKHALSDTFVEIHRLKTDTKENC